LIINKVRGGETMAKEKENKKEEKIETTQLNKEIEK